MRLTFRTPRAINDAARWTPLPRQGWLYWAVSGMVFFAAIFVSDRWGWLAGLTVLFVGAWLVDRALARKPDLDVESPDDARDR